MCNEHIPVKGTKVSYIFILAVRAVNPVSNHPEWVGWQLHDA
jgi:hypothetical protein